MSGKALNRILSSVDKQDEARSYTHFDSSVKQGSPIDMVGTWPARIDCDFQKTSFGRTALVGLSHEGPLRIQKLFHDRDLAHCYVLHPPGGMVSGDNLLS